MAPCSERTAVLPRYVLDAVVSMDTQLNMFVFLGVSAIRKLFLYFPFLAPPRDIWWFPEIGVPRNYPFVNGFSMK